MFAAHLRLGFSLGSSPQCFVGAAHSYFLRFFTEPPLAKREVPRFALDGAVRDGAEVGPRDGPVDFAAGFEGAVRTGAEVGPRDGPVDFVGADDREGWVREGADGETLGGPEGPVMRVGDDLDGAVRFGADKLLEGPLVRGGALPFIKGPRGLSEPTPAGVVMPTRAPTGPAARTTPRPIAPETLPATEDLTEDFVPYEVGGFEVGLFLLSGFDKNSGSVTLNLPRIF